MDGSKFEQYRENVTRPRIFSKPYVTVFRMTQPM